MKLRKSLILLGVTSALLLVLSGCKDKPSVEELQAQIGALQQENEELRTQVQGTGTTEQAVESSLRTVEGSNVPEFVTIEDKIVFPNALMLPESAMDVNNSNIRIGSRFTFTPSTNWLLQMNGSTLNMSHPSKIWGSVQAVYMQNNQPTRETYQSIVQQFFNNFPATNITYRKIYTDDWQSGVLARADITVDKKPHVVNVGFSVSGEYGVLFLFDYEDNKTGVQQELIDLFISSGGVGDNKFKLD